MPADDTPPAGSAPPADPRVTLETPRLRVRRLRPGDVDALLAIFGDPEVMRFWSSPPFEDRAAAEALLADVDALAARGDLVQWGVALRDDDRVIGTVTLSHLDPEQGRAEVGFALGRAFWGQGYATEAVEVLLDHAFGPLGLRRLEADVDPRNAPSLALLERLGFEREGYLRERWRVAGELQDTVLLGLLARDWRAVPGQR